MRIDSPNIGWHGLKDRILSIDFHPFSNELASGGSDDRKFLDQEREGTEGCIKIWEVINDGRPLHPDNHNLRIKYGLSEADKNTNVVRYSPNGAFLASGADDKCITIWQRRENCLSINRVEKIIKWSPKGHLMGHTEDVLDLNWTPDSRYIVSSGMDRRIFIWNVEKKYHVKVLDEHEKFVQGVAIDLRFEYILSCSNDRSAKIWKCVKTKRSQTEFYCKKALKRIENQKAEEEDNADQKTGFRIFTDESVPTFFRRPDVSPDGELFLFPAGIWHKTNESRPEYCCFLYRKNFLEKPTFVLPTNGEPALVCKFCPKLFKKTEEKGVFALPYYMIYAVATSSTVLIYSTEQTKPLFAMGNYHYAALTDLCWRGSQILAVSSSDGYCSFMIFKDNKLGEIYEPVGELAELMKRTEFVPKVVVRSETVNNPNQKSRVEYHQTENGMKKKRIIPKKIADI